jgi:hypothetical protein
MTKDQLIRKYFLLNELVNRLQLRGDSVSALQCELAKAEEAQTWAAILAA